MANKLLCDFIPASPFFGGSFGKLCLALKVILGESNLNELGPLGQMLGRPVLHFELGSRPGQLLHVPIVVVLQVPLLLFLLICQLVLVHEESIGEGQIRDLILIFYYFVGFF